MYYLFLTNFVSANEAYYYDSNSIAPLSQVFVDAQSELFPKYESLEKDITKYEVAIKKRELMMNLSDTSDGTYYQQFMEEKKKFIAIKLQFQKLSEDTINGYGMAFMKAIENEVNQNFQGAVECSDKQNLVMGLQLNKDTEECKGKNISQELAQAIDKNTTLKKEIQRINKQAWPNIILPNFQQNFDGDYIYISSIAEHFFMEELTYHNEIRKQGIDALELQSDDEQTKKQAIKQAQQLNKQYNESLQQYGSQIKLAMEKAGYQNFDICLTPKEFGGCTGNNITVDAINTIENHRKSHKLIKKMKY